MLPTPVRLRFTKVGALQFISHLDLNRTVKTVMLRAKIPVKYSEGFNPHPKITFALPLSIGAESICELMDFKVDREMSYEEIRERLNKALPPEMQVLEAYCPEEKFTGVHYAEYEIGTEEPFSVEPLMRDTIPVMKRTKSGTRETDIKPLIFSYEKIEGGLRCVLAADPEHFLNPEYVVSLLGLHDYTVLRTRMLKADGVTVFR